MIEADNPQGTAVRMLPSARKYMVNTNVNGYEETRFAALMATTGTLCSEVYSMSRDELYMRVDFGKLGKFMVYLNDLDLMTAVELEDYLPVPPGAA